MSILTRLFGKTIEQQVRAVLAVRETDATLVSGARSWTQSERDRYPFDRSEVLEQALAAWRLNPLARRIVGLTTQYVVGSGITFSCKHAGSDRFLKAFWNHRLNRLDVRLFEWCDELTRTGNLFIQVSTDAAGMSYVRALPAASIEAIECRSNDVEQPLAFQPKGSIDDPNPAPIPAYTEQEDDPARACMLHYAINRPVGAQWGESDLAPLLRWLARYANWLEDRARLNRYRNTFMFVVKSRFISEAERLARQQHLNASPPAPGSILVTDEGEEWSVINPNLESADAATDGLALKKMIASGAGVPLHFLAEPESATRTTAEAAGGPTYRHYEQRQKFFLWMVEDVLRVALQRRALAAGGVVRTAEVEMQGADISARDNVALGLAGANILAVLREMRDRRMIDDAEFLRMAYRFTGETVDIPAMLGRGKAAAPVEGTGAGGQVRQPDPLRKDGVELKPNAAGEG